jgi:hypothetical protein
MPKNPIFPQWNQRFWSLFLIFLPPKIEIYPCHFSMRQIHFGVIFTGSSNALGAIVALHLRRKLMS